MELRITLMLTAMFLNAFVILQLWTWFLLPLGLPFIDYKQAIGLDLFIGFTTYHFYSFKREELSVDVVINSIIIRPILVLIIGWVVHWI